MADAQIIIIVASELRRGPHPFAREAEVRQRLRAGLCLAGWSWIEADAEAREIVEAALELLGAERPRPAFDMKSYARDRRGPFA